MANQLAEPSIHEDCPIRQVVGSWPALEEWESHGRQLYRSVQPGARSSLSRSIPLQACRALPLPHLLSFLGRHLWQSTTNIFKYMQDKYDVQQQTYTFTLTGYGTACKSKRKQELAVTRRDQHGDSRSGPYLDAHSVIPGLTEVASNPEFPLPANDKP